MDLAASAEEDNPPGSAAAELVFFQHDELVVHAVEELAEPVIEAIIAAAQEASDLLFPGTAVRFPLQPVVVQDLAKGH